MRLAIARDSGVLCAGVTFLPADAMASFVRDVGEGSLLSGACDRLRPDFLFVCSWDADAESVCAEVAACGTVPFWVVRGPLDAIAASRGWSEALAGTVEDSGGIAEQMDRFVDEACSSVAQAAASGAGGVVVAEDIATPTGPLLDPEYAARELMPRLGSIAQAVARVGLVSVWHSDGDVRPLVPYAAAEGFDGLHPGGLDEQTFERVLFEARRARLAVLGGISGHSLRGGGHTAVNAGVAASRLADAGGLLVSDDGGVTTAEELESLACALEAARKTFHEHGESW